MVEVKSLKLGWEAVFSIFNFPCFVFFLSPLLVFFFWFVGMDSSWA